jgi:hypothetical protein
LQLVPFCSTLNSNETTIQRVATNSVIINFNIFLESNMKNSFIAAAVAICIGTASASAANALTFYPDHPMDADHELLLLRHVNLKAPSVK